MRGTQGFHLDAGIHFTGCTHCQNCYIRLYKRYLVTKQGKEYEQYIKKRNECTREIKKAKKKHERNIAKGCKENPNKFWKYVNDKCKTNVGISSLKDEKGNLITNDKERAEILNNFFTSVFLKEDTSNLPNIKTGEYSNGKLMEDIKITKDMVEKKLKELNPNKAQGPDSIPPRVLREIHKEIAEPLTILFQKTIDSGEISKELKTAEVTAKLILRKVIEQTLEITDRLV